MRSDRLDCSWCGSAASIDHGLCQVCLMEYPLETKVITLPVGNAAKKNRRVTIDLNESEVGVAE